VYKNFNKIIKNDIKLRYYHLYDTTRALFRNTPMYPINNGVNNGNPPFFIIGSGRSGNTLLRSMLTQGNGVVIPPESYVIGSVIRKYQILTHYKNFSWNEICAVVIACFNEHPEFKWWYIDTKQIYERLINIDDSNKNLAFLLEQFYLEYANQNNIELKIWGDKTPLNSFHLKKIYQTFPNAKFIHIIRDGRDVASSYRKSGLYDSLEQGCNRWNDSIKYIHKFSRKLKQDQMYEVKYEDLVNNTEGILQKISKFLNITYSKHMINRTNSKKLGDVEGLNHHAKVHSKISSSSIGKWKINLTLDEQKAVNEMCDYYLRKLNYK
jgi:protein-tyrosine sulfotransferase